MTTAVLSAQPELALQVRLLGNETAKGLRLAWHRKGMVAVGVILGALNYLGISLFIGGGHVVEELMALTLPGLLAVVVAQAVAIDGSGGIAEEINGGTLEQTQLSPASPYLQVLGRLAALGVVGLVTATPLAIAFTVVFDLGYGWHITALVPAALTVLDALGYGLLIIAFTIRVASIGAITHVFNMVIMLFGGMLVPVTTFPDGVEIFTHFVPTALGVQALNTTMTTGGLAASWSDGTLPWLLVHTTVLFAGGLAGYAATLRRAKREGALSP
ncbi:hypothetical protein GCM10009789_37410 [Kribbella sancticallisti]|uniref:ABC-2 type transporter transmembrane domain-containing protein n=1 Tax=Kribbella sancticallisti TaxID=460087 RepID=A0ABN2DPJ2_9ACTN